jgi:lipopolysaccharide export system protein LptC
MGTKPAVNVNTILTSLVLCGILWLARSVNTLQQDMASMKQNQQYESDAVKSFVQDEKDFDHRIRDLEFKKHGDGL